CLGSRAGKRSGLGCGFSGQLFTHQEATADQQKIQVVAAELAPVVTISQGSLRGVAATTRDNTTYHKFLGIPYAQPPVGPLRFKGPQAPGSWRGVRDSSSFGAVCKQRGAVSAEDCLFLNVFTPNLPGRRNITLWPTMVWIHGGAFVKGSGDVDPGHLLDLGVVVVSVNYRLGVFGFLGLAGSDAGGNAGLKDQVAALRWVRSNVAAFGGDPRMVTIFGASAGAASVHYQVLSPAAAGLFRAAISQSGSALDPWAFRQHSDELTERLARRLGLGGASGQQLVDCLRTVDPEQLLSVSSLLLAAGETSMYISEPFVPSLDHAVPGEEQFLTALPRDLEEKGLFSAVPYMAGTNKLEAGRFVGSATAMENASYWNQIASHLERIVPAELQLKRGSNASQAMASRIKDLYFPNETMSYKTRQNWIDLQTDYQFTVGDQRRLNHHIQHTNHTYEYQFSYGESTHGAEVSYVMCHVPSAESHVCRLVGEMWTNFAKNLDPSTAALAWRPATARDRCYLDIDSRSVLVRGTKVAARTQFWQGVFGPKY
ncbi:carboxylic ester hydrolase-like, partial [Bacillus rossius redtenbacheri]|uniref:carboxylic ester hydrolase-like n=1 Tax=Bacillus rossius redtenbacheri TaxID=93214 RepID=UPI002FDEF879